MQTAGRLPKGAAPLLAMLEAAQRQSAPQEHSGKR